MDDRISKLETLVWDLYNELNNKISNAVTQTEIQLNETKIVTNKIFDQLSSEIWQLKVNITKLSPVEGPSQDDGYNGSDEFEDDPNEETEQQFLNGGLDEVAEEMTSQYWSENEILRPNESYDQSIQVVEPTWDLRPPQISFYDSKDSKKTSDEAGVYTFDGNRYNYDNSEKKLSIDPSSNIRNDLISPFPEGEGDDDLDYYFSCHERMMNSHNDGKYFPLFCI